jgi:hypothetical protein
MMGEEGLNGVPALFSRQAHEFKLVTFLEDIRCRHVPPVHQGQGPGVDIQRLFQGLAHLADGLAGDGGLQVMDSVADLNLTGAGLRVKSLSWALIQLHYLAEEGCALSTPTVRICRINSLISAGEYTRPHPGQQISSPVHVGRRLMLALWQ